MMDLQRFSHASLMEHNWWPQMNRFLVKVPGEHRGSIYWHIDTKVVAECGS